MKAPRPAHSLKPSNRLPSLKALTARLRELHTAWAHPDAGGEYVQLWTRGTAPWQWEVRAGAESLDNYGREYIPGDGKPFDAVAAARRLLAAARDGLSQKAP